MPAASHFQHLAIDFPGPADARRSSHPHKTLGRGRRRQDRLQSPPSRPGPRPQQRSEARGEAAPAVAGPGGRAAPRGSRAGAGARHGGTPLPSAVPPPRPAPPAAAPGASPRRHRRRRVRLRAHLLQQLGRRLLLGVSLLGAAGSRGGPAEPPRPALPHGSAPARRRRSPTCAARRSRGSARHSPAPPGPAAQRHPPGPGAGRRAQLFVQRVYFIHLYLQNIQQVQSTDGQRDDRRGTDDFSCHR